MSCFLSSWTVDRLEDMTPPSKLHESKKCNRTVCLYGYVRGVHLKNTFPIHIPGKFIKNRFDHLFIRIMVNVRVKLTVTWLHNHRIHEYKIDWLTFITIMIISCCMIFIVWRRLLQKFETFDLVWYDQRIKVSEITVSRKSLFFRIPALYRINWRRDPWSRRRNWSMLPCPAWGASSTTKTRFTSNSAAAILMPPNQ